MAYILYSLDLLRKAPFLLKIKTAYTTLQLSHLASQLHNLSSSPKPSQSTSFRAEIYAILMPIPPFIMTLQENGAERAMYQNQTFTLKQLSKFLCQKTGSDNNPSQRAAERR